LQVVDELGDLFHFPGPPALYGERGMQRIIRNFPAATVKRVSLPPSRLVSAGH